VDITNQLNNNIFFIRVVEYFLVIIKITGFINVYYKYYLFTATVSGWLKFMQKTV